MHRSLLIKILCAGYPGKHRTCDNASKAGIWIKEGEESIIEGLKGIQADVENGTLEITDEYEDIHSFVEANLIDRIGDAGKKLHTGRSRMIRWRWICGCTQETRSKHWIHF